MKNVHEAEQLTQNGERNNQTMMYHHILTEGLREEEEDENQY